MRYTFEWNPSKAKRNTQKHNISFERATEVFLDPMAISLFDEEHSDKEERWITIGTNSFEMVVVVVHTFREVSAEETIIRIISARKATKNEMKQYKEG